MSWRTKIDSAFYQPKARLWKGYFKDRSPESLTKFMCTVDSQYLEPKSNLPGFLSYIYCNFTLCNSNLPLTPGNFCFPSGHFYTILPSITQTMMFCRDKSKKSHWAAVQNIKFISKQQCTLGLYFLTVQLNIMFNHVLINQAFFKFPFSK